MRSFDRVRGSHRLFAILLDGKDIPCRLNVRVYPLEVKECFTSNLAFSEREMAA